MQPAFVLHSRLYRNTSLLVDCFTQDHGLVPAVARGARRRQSRLRGLLQPFRPLVVSWHGRGELVTLSGAEDQGMPYRLVGAVLASAFYLNELLQRLVPRHDPHPALFGRYAATLLELARLSPPAVGGEAAALQRTLRLFEKALLRELGFGMLLDCTAGGEPVRADMLYHYHGDDGPVPAAGAAPGTVSGRTLLALADERLDDAEILLEAKRLMRRLLEAHLGGRPLGSRELIEVYRRSGGAAAPPAVNSEHET